MQKKIFILFILFYSFTFSQIKQSKANIDYACFPLNKDSISLELYIEVLSKDLSYNPHDSILYKSRLNIDITITKLSDSAISKVNWDYDTYNRIEDLKKELQVIVIKKFELISNQEYTINVEIKNENKILKYSTFNVKKHIDENAKIYLSDIEFAYYISENINNLKFGKNYQKNNLEIIPNSTSEYYGNDEDIKCYIEIRKMDSISNLKKIKYEILNGANKTIAEFEYPIIKSNLDKIIEYRTLPLFDMTTGIYTLKAVVFTENMLDSTYISKKFYYLNPNTIPKLVTNFKESQAFEESLFTSLSADKIDLEFAKTKPILSEFEIDEFQRLSTLKAKQRAMFKFWKYRDNDSTSEKNEMYIEYHQKLDYIDKTFAYGRKDGAYKTDRGKVILKYGMPTQRNRFSSTSDKVACEEWFFDIIGGGLYFYFVDRSGNDDFTLVHSNAKNEPKDLNWVQNYNPNIDTDNSSRFKDQNDYQK